MKIFKNWKIMFLVFVVLIYSLFFATIVKEKKRLPSPKWSREIELNVQNNLSIVNAKKEKLTFTIPLENENSILSIFVDNKVNILLTKADGNIILNKTISNLQLNNTSNIQEIFSGKIINGKLTLYFISNNKLYSNLLDLKSYELGSSILIDDFVKSAKYKNGFLAIEKLDSLNILDLNSNKNEYVYKNISFSKLKEYDLFTDSNYIYIVYSGKFSDNNKYLKLSKINIKTKNIATAIIDKLPNSTFISSKYLSINVNKSKVNILEESEEFKTGKTTLKHYYLDKNLTNINKSELTKLKYSIYPKLISSKGNDIDFIISIPTTMGATKIVYNLNIISLINEKIDNKTTLTKTNKKSISPTLFKLKNSKYITWSDIDQNSRELMLLSNNKDFIKTSRKLTTNEKIDSLITWIITIFPTLLGTMIPIITIAGTTAIILVILSIKFLNYMEQNFKKTFNFSVLIHTSLKMLFLYNMIFLNKAILNIKDQLPVFLTNFPLLVLTIFITTSLSYYLYKIKYTSEQHNEFWMSYMFFGITDLIMFSLLVIPYFYTYLALPIFFNK
ncbi:hypothetical protein [Helicovermis profundi]|uniref:Uncharacterized protein n=1 Tax=Helicovermis profundi TaxID=3065157 RepID=A0AAU9EEP2_9FIRM|nr:hypothetical protein HLPR_02190 [Clostridia bacterium S502]